MITNGVAAESGLLVEFGEAFHQGSGQPQQLLLGRRQGLRHRGSEPRIAVLHIPAEAPPTLRGDVDLRLPAINLPGSPGNQALLLETGAGAGERLRFESLRGAQLAGCERAARLQI